MLFTAPLRTACAALGLAIAIPLTATTARPAPAPERPNVIFILVDDLGWMDLACQGNERLDTPHIDRLARDGMRFTDAYAPAPVCSPTRASLLTGLAPARLAITNHIPDRADFTPPEATFDPAATGDRLPLDARTIAECVRDAGYATAFLGKWHLSGHWRDGKDGAGDERFHPEAQGFDRNLGGCALGGPPTYFDPYGIAKLPGRRPGEYLPERLADEAIAFVREHRARPFLLCLWTYTVHWPMEAPAELVSKYDGREGPGIKDVRYAAMIEALDTAVGRLLEAVRELDLDEQTLVIFTSDNGGFSGVADNRPLRAGKGYLFEGGIRVPLIVRWPGVIEAGAVCRTPVIGTDLAPTILEATGCPEKDIRAARDGTSLLPLLRGAKEPHRDALFFHYPNYAWHRANRLGGAIRAGRYKLIEYFDDGAVELFDLAADLGETTDLAAEKPEIAAELRARLDAWQRETGARMPRARQERSDDTAR